jgi:hypothetical protein
MSSVIFTAWNVDPAFSAGAITAAPPGTITDNGSSASWAAAPGGEFDLADYLITVEVLDNDGDGWLRPGSADRVVINGVTHTITTSYVGDMMTIDGVDYTVVTVYLSDGQLFSLPMNASGQLVQAFPGTVTATNYVFDPSEFPLDFAALENLPELCIAEGMRVLTAQGMIRVEALCPGDLVWTLDHGLQPLLWVGQMPMQTPAVRISANALAPSVPLRDLLISPEHRVFVGLACGAERLLAARHLVDSTGVRLAPGVLRGARARSWVHLLFARHEILVCEGVALESLFIGRQVIGHLPPAALAAFTRARGVLPALVTGAAPVWPGHARARPFAGKGVVGRVARLGLPPAEMLQVQTNVAALRQG